MLVVASAAGTPRTRARAVSWSRAAAAPFGCEPRARRLAADHLGAPRPAPRKHGVPTSKVRSSSPPKLNSFAVLSSEPLMKRSPPGSAATASTEAVCASMVRTSSSSTTTSSTITGWPATAAGRSEGVSGAVPFASTITIPTRRPAAYATLLEFTSKTITLPHAGSVEWVKPSPSVAASRSIVIRRPTASPRHTLTVLSREPPRTSSGQRQCRCAPSAAANAKFAASPEHNRASCSGDGATRRPQSTSVREIAPAPAPPFYHLNPTHQGETDAV